MDGQTNVLSYLSLIVAPAVLTNASSVLVMSTTNRLARAVDRARELARQLDETVDQASSQAVRRLNELASTERRNLLLLSALRSVYFALGGFASATLFAQNEITPEALIRHNQSASAGGVTSVENIFNSTAASTAWFYAAGNLSLSQWMGLVHDTTSVAQHVAFPYPNRTIATYHQSIGGGASLEAFLAQARLQSKDNWRLEYTAAAVNAYIRAGFGVP